jgi:hypothetical protein
MTGIDPQADIEIRHSQGHLTTSIPLAGQITPEWLQWYQKLARDKGLPAQAEVQPGQAWIRIRVPAGSHDGEVLAIMDAARDLTAEADAATAQPRTAHAETITRDWWARQRS